MADLSSGAPAYAGTLAKLRAMGVKPYWSLNSRSSLNSVNQLRMSLGLGKVDSVEDSVLEEMENMLCQ